MTAMRALTPGFLIAAVLGATATAQPAPTAQGDWVTEGGWATVRIAPCPGETARLCGRIVALKEPTDGKGRPKRDTANVDPSLRGRLLVGMPFITGFKPAGSGRWSGGKIYNPGDGKTYSSRMALSPNGSLKVHGCVLVICQGQTWTRAAS